jgi:AraC-like DNA-binding protein
MTPVRDDIAGMLGLSGRSLHRKLEESGSSFRELMDEVRLDIACHTLTDTTIAIGQLGQQLGFGDSQSFIRWFKRLKGVTPGDFRTHPPT